MAASIVNANKFSTNKQTNKLGQSIDESSTSKIQFSYGGSVLKTDTTALSYPDSIEAYLSLYCIVVSCFLLLNYLPINQLVTIFPELTEGIYGLKKTFELARLGEVLKVQITRMHGYNILLGSGTILFCLKKRKKHLLYNLSLIHI